MKKSRDYLLGILTGAFVVVIIVAGIKVGTSYLNNSSNKISERTESKLDYLQRIINKYYLDSDKIDEEAEEANVYKGLLNGLGDPYSVYYTADEYKKLQEMTSGTYGGIGVVVTQDTETGVVTAMRVFEKSPSAKAGLKAGDIFFEVAGEKVTGMDLNEITSKIKGEKGTKVKIKIYRSSDDKYIDFEIERADVDIPTVSHKMLDNKVGYISIIEFDEITYEQFTEAIEDLKSQGMESVIFDVRDNPGGLYTSVVAILDDLLPKGTLVYTIDKEGNKQVQSSDSECLEIPMVVLQNENSASASEIFAGAIKDFKAGTIVGKTSFGKGIVQSVLPLRDGSALKLTVEKYYTPNGVNIHGTGIEPDVEAEDDINTEKDEQLQKATDILTNK